MASEVGVLLVFEVTVMKLAMAWIQSTATTLVMRAVETALSVVVTARLLPLSGVMKQLTHSGVMVLAVLLVVTPRLEDLMLVRKGLEVTPLLKDSMLVRKGFEVTPLLNSHEDSMLVGKRFEVTPLLDSMLVRPGSAVTLLLLKLH